MKIHNWTDFDNQLDNAFRQPEAPVALKCPTCQAEYFEKVKIGRYMAAHSVIPGQDLNEMSPGTFILLRCVSCQAMVEPKTVLAANDPAAKPYRLFIDELKKSGTGNAI